MTQILNKINNSDISISSNPETTDLMSWIIQAKAQLLK